MKKLNEISKAEQKPPKGKKKKLLTAILCAVVLAPLALLAVTLASFAIWAGTQKIDSNALPTASAIPVFYDCDGERIGGDIDGYVRAGEAPEALKNAFVAIEDKRFYSHKGYDPVRIAGAMLKNLKSGGVKEGASTITQQLIKNTHLTSERSVKRKLKEIALAADLEKKYSKEDILNMYMSVIYFGGGAYGVKSAAKKFFSKNIEELSLSQCATLAGIVKNPAGYSPVNHPEACKKRRDLVLSLMCEQGLITTEERDEALRDPLVATPQVPHSDPDNFGLYLALAKQQVCDALGMTGYELDNSGLHIYTSLNVDVQRALESERRNESNFESSDVANSAVVVDNATGATIAVSSTYPYQVYRQTGSVLKPLAVYAPALDMRAVTLATPITDEEINFSGFSPSNFNGKFYGDTTVLEAIKKSMNSVSVKILDYIGVEKCASYLASMGIDVAPSNKNYALALGALSCSPLEIAQGYAALARDGVYSGASFVKYVVKDGKKTDISKIGKSVVSPACADVITSALIETAKDGTAKGLGVLPFDVAAKTGTAERSDGKNSDAWAASYNDSYTVVVWHGSDDGMMERGGGYPIRHSSAIWKKLSLESGFKPTIELKTAAPLTVDSYSTKILKKVVLANENTPLEYRNTLYFDPSALPVPCASLFDEAAPCPLEVDVREGHVELKFDAQKIYGYDLFRTDIFGRALILSMSGDDGEIHLKDVPIGFGSVVKYELVCYVKNNPRAESTTLKHVFFEPGYAA